MLLDSAPSAASLVAGPGSLRIRRADRQDAELLLPLRLAYEREEVLPPGAPTNIPATRMSLEKSLADRLVLVAELDGEVVATAATNARAFTRHQIGGVYVVPALRDRGIGTRIVAELGALLREEHWGAVLFVKTSNIPAIRAYGRIGFQTGDPYRIVYFS
jgi:predicted GNAT family acetyltransferase